MDENPTDVESEVTPEDFFEGEQDTSEAESSPAETKQPDTAKAEATEEETKDGDGDDTPTETEESDAEETETDKPEETETDKPKGLQSRANKVNSEIRDLVAQRNALKAEVEKLNAEVYQPATEKDLIGEINPETGEKYTATDAKVEALRQEMAMRDYNESVAETQLTLASESNQVLQDFGIFNPESELYNEELAGIAAETLDANLIRDENTGQVVGVNPGFETYKFYETLAKAAGVSSAQGQLKGQQAAEKMLANADSPGSAAPPKKAKDPVLAIWESDD